MFFVLVNLILSPLAPPAPFLYFFYQNSPPRPTDLAPFSSQPLPSVGFHMLSLARFGPALYASTSTFFQSQSSPALLTFGGQQLVVHTMAMPQSHTG